MGVEYRFTSSNLLYDLQVAAAWVNHLRSQMAPDNPRRSPDTEAVVADSAKIQRQLPLLSLAVEAEADEVNRQHLVSQLAMIESTLALILRAVQLDGALNAANRLVAEMRRSRSPNQEQIKSWGEQIEFWVKALDVHNTSALGQKDKRRIRLTRRDLANWGYNLHSQHRGRLGKHAPRSRPVIDILEVDNQIGFALELSLQGSGQF